MNNVIKKIRQELKEKADEGVKRGGERFFKEQIKLYGVKTAVVSKIGKECFKEIKGQGKAEIFSLCDFALEVGIYGGRFYCLSLVLLSSKIL